MPLTKEVELEYLLQRVSGPRVSYSGKNSPSHEVAAILASRDSSSSNKGVLVSYVFVLDLNLISNKTQKLPLQVRLGQIRNSSCVEQSYIIRNRSSDRCVRCDTSKSNLTVLE